MNTPQYIGPYSAETYDQMYGTGALFTQHVNNFTPPNPSPSMSSARFSLCGGPWGCSDLILFVVVVLLISLIAYFVIK